MKYYSPPTNPTNLANLPEGDLRAAISSPPYAESVHDGNGIDPAKLTGNPAGRNSQAFAEGYGNSPGQLGAMREGALDAVVSSPPYEGSMDHAPGNKSWQLIPTETQLRHGNSTGYSGQVLKTTDYGKSEGQLGNEAGDTFWAAARQIVEGTYAVLAGGAHAIWVLKGFVRNKEYVDFPDQWRQLCEACGFEALHWHRAWLIEDRGQQWTLFGELEQQTVERKSFFRRLAESKGSPRVDYEVVLCMVKP